MRIAILGRTQLLYDTIEVLLEAGHQIVIIGTCEEAPEYSIGSEDFKSIANRMNIPFFKNSNLSDDNIIALLMKCNAEVAISVNWINIIGKKTIDCFKYGILNAHAGDLPKYRGNACPNWAILLGDPKIAVTIHFMEAGKLDSGDILVKQYYEITQRTKIFDIYQWLKETVPSLFLKAINGLEAGSIIPKPQSRDVNDILRVYPRTPSDGLINWRMDSKAIERLVNASSAPFAGAYTFYNMKKLIIWEAYSVEWDLPSRAICGQVVRIDRDKEEVGVACGNGILMLVKIQVENSTIVNPTDFIRSMRDRLGMNIEDEFYKLYCLFHGLK